MSTQLIPEDSAVTFNAGNGENSQFLSEQIITYIGNKRALLDFIGRGVAMVQRRLGRSKMITADVFAGSGVVSRYLKAYSDTLYVNDLELYSEIINRCYLANQSEVNMPYLRATLRTLRADIERTWAPGIIAELYAPQDDNDIQPGERVFYTRRNAVYLDTARRLIGELPEEVQPFFLAPLLYEASVHNNTSGVFKGFYKNYAGVGQFGGEGRNALVRITGEIELRLPFFSSFDCRTVISRSESLDAVRSLPELDLCYLDPPYNQHPYGSNYFMLNVLAEYKRPQCISDVSGIPDSWNRSDYNKRRSAKEKLFSLVRECPARFVLISYNSEGFISYAEFMDSLSSLGKVTPMETEYSAFKGSRNLASRELKVSEYLFLLEKR